MRDLQRADFFCLGSLFDASGLVWIQKFQPPWNALVNTVVVAVVVPHGIAL